MFIRPALSESQFDMDECEFSEPEEDEPVSLCPVDRLIPHPSWCPATAPTAMEADRFWRDGGWDD